VWKCWLGHLVEGGLVIDVNSGLPGEDSETRVQGKWVRSLDIALRLDELICGLLLISIVVLLAVGVVLRYVFFTSYPWADELVSFSFIWFVYLGMVIAVRKNRHFRVQVLLNYLPEGLRRQALWLSDVTWLAFNAVVVAQGVKLVEFLHRFPGRSPMLGWSMEYVYVIIPISFAFTSVWIVLRLVKAWEWKRPRPTEGSAG
jgi:TRAP-type C4-dicarboxylate transport system permease small subunit